MCGNHVPATQRIRVGEGVEWGEGCPLARVCVLFTHSRTAAELSTSAAPYRKRRTHLPSTPLLPPQQSISEHAVHQTLNIFRLYFVPHRSRHVHG